jgi:hypothetical protein
MNLSRGDLAAIVGLSSFIAVGAWDDIHPEGWIRYFLKSRIQISPYDRQTRFIARFISICVALLGGFMVFATLKIR